MSIYETEEEQIEAIKGWLKKYGKSVLIGIIVALIISFGWRYWQKEQASQRIEASMSYEELLMAVDKQDAKVVLTLANHLIDDYSHTTYAQLGAFILAKQFVQENQLKKAEEKLAWVAKKAKMPAIQQIAKIRLARVWLAQKENQKALETLSHVSDPAFEPLIEATKGDIEMALNNKETAKEAYRKALSSWPEDVPGKAIIKYALQELAS